MALAGLLNIELQPLPPSEQPRGYVARPKQRYYLIARNTGTDDFPDVGPLFDWPASDTNRTTSVCQSADDPAITFADLVAAA
jgi:hypothetical protein